MRTPAAGVRVRFDGAANDFTSYSNAIRFGAPLPALGVCDCAPLVTSSAARQFTGKAAPAFCQRLSLEMGGCCALIG